MADSTLLVIGEMGCPEPLPRPPGPGYVPVSTPTGIAWQMVGASGPTTVGLAMGSDGLTVTVDGVTGALMAVPLTDAFGLNLGYLLPV